MQKCSAILTVGVLWALSAAALERPDTTFKIFQFPRRSDSPCRWGCIRLEHGAC